MQRDYVAFLEKRVKGNVVYSVSVDRVWVICNDFHSKSFAYVNKNSSDLSSANNARGLAVKVEAGKSAEAEIEVARPDERFVYLSV